MDVKEFIESGIIESVVLGFASEQEIAQLQSYAARFPEIREEWLAVSRAFETEATKHAVEAPASVKAAVLASIAPQTTTPKEEKAAPIVQLNAGKTGNPWKWLAAASIVLAIGSSTLWYLNYREMETMRNQLASKSSEVEAMDQQITAMSVEQEKSMELKKVLAQLDTKNIEMSGTPMEPTANVHIMWNPENKMAVMKSVAINSIPYEMQFQLWAIADGKPVSLGVFDGSELEEMTDPFQVLTDNISAFAITIEKRGGSQSPTMDKMVVMGTVTS